MKKMPFANIWFLAHEKKGMDNVKGSEACFYIYRKLGVMIVDCRL